MRGSLFYAATLVALFIGALVANRREGGTSPIVWIDTFNDEAEVRQCLDSDSCTLLGVETSIPGQVHAVGWLELRSLLAWLRAGFDATQLVMQLLNALAVVLVFDLATQLGSRLAGVAAVAILTLGIGPLGVPFTALHNMILLPFLGAVLVLACAAVVERPGLLSVALAALVGAVMANVHLACILTGASVVWVALIAPRHRVPLAAFGAALFALATFLLAPPAWLHNAMSLAGPREALGHTTDALTWHGGGLICWVLLAMAAWVASFGSRAAAAVAYRRRSQGAFAVLVPFLAAFLVAPWLGIDANAKYLTHLKAACAIAAALPLALVGALLRPLLRRRLSALRPALLGTERCLPFALAFVMCANVTTADQGMPTIADLGAVAHVLHDEHGWDLPRMLASLKTPAGAPVLMGLRQVGAAEHESSPAAADGAASGLLLLLDPEDLPNPLPASWTIVRRSARAATVLIVMQSRIDWSRFEVCVRPANGRAEPCDQSGLRLDEAAPGFSARNMPSPGVSAGDTLTLRLPLRPAVAGPSDEIFMPRIHQLCGGHIASASGGGVRVEPDRRHAVLSDPDAGQAPASTIELEWQIGAPECDGMAYDGLPPFVIEGDSDSVRRVEDILRKSEG